MNRVLTAVLAGLFSASMTAAQIQPVLDTVVTDKQGSGSIDWTNRIIYSKGIGAPGPDQPEAAQRAGAIRAAQLIALRNALETLKGIFLNSSTTVENFMVKSDVITSRVSGFVRGFEQKGKEKYMSDGSVELVMTVPLDGVGGIEDMLLGGTGVSDKPSITAFEGTKAKKTDVFTGLIIDCHGLNVKPPLPPRYLTNQGKKCTAAPMCRASGPSSTASWAMRKTLRPRPNSTARARRRARSRPSRPTAKTPPTSLYPTLTRQMCAARPRTSSSCRNAGSFWSLTDKEDVTPFSPLP